MSMLPEILFDVPGTAHCIGGCVIADSPDHGVVDSRHRVFDYKNMYICDGSVVAANLGRQSQPDHYCAGRAGDELYSSSSRDGLERWRAGRRRLTPRSR